MVNVAPQPVSDGKRTASLVVGWIALVPTTILVASLIFFQATTHGQDSIVILLPMVGLFVSGWVWFVLAAIALVLGILSRRRVLPVILASLTLVQLIVFAAVILMSRP